MVRDRSKNERYKTIFKGLRTSALMRNTAKIL